MGLSVKYFYSLTPRQFANIVEGYNIKEEEKIKRQYEITRMIMYASLVPWQKIKVEDVLTFPWDKSQQPKANSQKPKKRKYKTKKELAKIINQSE